MRLELVSWLAQSFFSWSMCMWEGNGKLKKSIFWIGKQTCKHFCVRGWNIYLCYCLHLYLLGFTCISAKGKFKHVCFPGTLGAGYWVWLWSDPVWLIYWKENIFVLNVLGLISLFYEHRHGHPKPRMVDSVLRVLAFVLKGASTSPFFTLKNKPITFL